jgi:hypothetical protein
MSLNPHVNLPNEWMSDDLGSPLWGRLPRGRNEIEDAVGQAGLVQNVGSFVKRTELSLPHGIFQRPKPEFSGCIQSSSERQCFRR